MATNLYPSLTPIVTSHCTYCSAIDNGNMINCAGCHTLCHRTCAGLLSEETCNNWKCRACDVGNVAPGLSDGIDMTDCAFELGEMVSDVLPTINLAKIAIKSSEAFGTEEVITNAPTATGLTSLLETTTSPNDGEFIEKLAASTIIADCTTNNDDNEDLSSCCCLNGDDCGDGDGDGDGDCDCCGDCCIQ